MYRAAVRAVANTNTFCNWIPFKVITSFGSTQRKYMVGWSFMKVNQQAGNWRTEEAKPFAYNHLPRIKGGKKVKFGSKLCPRSEPPGQAGTSRHAWLCLLDNLHYVLEGPPKATSSPGWTSPSPSASPHTQAMHSSSHSRRTCSSLSIPFWYWQTQKWLLYFGCRLRSAK